MRELQDVKALLNDVFHGQKSNLQIDVQMPFANLDLAQRADSLGLDAPPELLPLELTIHHLEQQALQSDDRMGELAAAKMKLQLTPPTGVSAEELTKPRDQIAQEMAGIRAKQDAFREQADDLKPDYKALVEEMVKDAVLRDLVRIAQTGVGRDLLQQIAKTSLDENAKKVTIRAFDQHVAATAGEDKTKQTPYVNYTPQYFRDRDTKQREEGGAIRKAEELAVHNPWQENTRTDITLFHELVHTHHYQSGTLKADNQLVPAESAVADVDKPYGEGENRKGVREEEYFTVGLGDHKDEKFTENRYRHERRQLGEEVSPRTYYTHMDAEKKPISL